MSTSEGDGKCSEGNVVISEGIYHLNFIHLVLEADVDANVLDFFLARQIAMYLSKYFQSGVLADFVRQSHLTNVGGLKKLGSRC